MLPLLLNFLGFVLTVSSSHLALLRPLDDQLPLIARVAKPFSWSFSPATFGNANGPIKLSASSLPSWLSFDPENLNFHGTPSLNDVGNPKITVTASDSTSTMSAAFTLCVTSFPEPVLRTPIADQFSTPSSSLSSVFALAPNSGLKTSNPALRIPPKWSFSIGFKYETFDSENDLFYEARLRDGSALPDWTHFNSKAMTVNGVVPNENLISQPTVIPMSLIASDQEGYSSSSLPFDIIIASRELSASTESLPTINITASTAFNISLSSPADYVGVLVDGNAIQPSQISVLKLDVSQYDWLKYDEASRTLSGDPKSSTSGLGNNPSLPVTLSTTFNQSIQTQVSLAVVPSYFSSSALSPIQVSPGALVQFDLVQDFSNATPNDDAKLTAALEPPDAEEWLKFDPGTGQLSGTVPSDFSVSHVVVTFTAYSRVSHSTSHTSLPILIASSEHTKKGYGSHPVGLSATAHAKLVLGLGIAFGVVGGLCLIGGLLAIFRHCARVEDTAVGGEEGKNVWSEQDKKWYGLGLQKARGYGWSDRDPNFTEKPRPALELRASYDARNADAYGNLGLGLRRVSERSQSGTSSLRSNTQSPGVMSKREFITRIRETVRIVSDRAQGRKVSRNRPVIGKPILSAHQQAGIAAQTQPPTVVNSPSNPFDGPGLRSHPGSTIMTNSPSASTAEHSIPRRRADFAPPRSPALVHFEDARLSRQLSSGSTSSLTSNTSAAGAVVQAAKATSIRSMKSGSSEPPGTRPRLVPFTSASRVPVPRQPASPGLQNDPQGSMASGKRVASQTAKVWKREARDSRIPEAMAKSGSGDELRMGLHYIQSLGADKQVSEAAPPRSLSSFLDTSPHDDPRETPKDVLKMLVRSGERFRFRVPISPADSSTASRTRKFDIRLMSGKPLPKFLHVDMSGIKTKGAIEFYGAPASGDLGEMTVGVYVENGVCIRTVIVEVIKWQ